MSRIEDGGCRVDDDDDDQKQGFFFFLITLISSDLLPAFFTVSARCCFIGDNATGA
jgi:hypothetical protein